MRIPRTARVGIGGFLAAIILFLGTKYWVESRTFAAVDVPVSLSRGRLHSGEFEINVDAFYSILIVFPEGSTPNCSERSLRSRRISSVGKLAVYHQNGDRAESGEDVTPGPFLGGFESKPGHYNLEIEILSDTSCLNDRKPRLFIIASASDFNKWNQRYEDAFWIALISGSIAFALLIIGVKESLRERPAENSNLSFCESRSDEDFPAHLKITRVSWFPRFSQIGLLYSQILLLLLIPGILVFHYAWGSYRSEGLFVAVGLSPLMKDRTCGEAWVVRIDARENWHLNSTKTSQKELAEVLSQQLRGQTNCAVYLDVDPSLPYAVAIQAIDTIQNTRANVVVLLTPRTE